jgi:5-carboxymethyl-2-hydroxymuconate isomerase
LPHCIIEHAPTIPNDELNQRVFAGAMASNLFAPDGSDIKVRSIAYEYYQTGSKREDFIHVTIRILSGRNEESKMKLSHSVLEQLKSLSLSEASLTVEIVDIDRDSYAKCLV